MNCPHCHQEIDQPAAPDVREVVRIRGEKYAEVSTKRLAPGKNVRVGEGWKWTISVPLVIVEKVRK